MPFFGACSDAPEQVEEVLRPVRYQTLEATDAVRQRQLAGIAKAGLESELSFRVNGRLERLDATVGKQVKRGQEIARVDGTDYRIGLKESEASLAQAQAARRQAEADYERVRGLYENENAAKSDLDAARAQSESAAAQVEAAQQRVASAQRQLSFTRLRAPVDGAIAAVMVEVNENLQAGQPVAVLTSGSQPEVEVAVPEALIAQVQEGDTVSVRFDALPDAELSAVITEVGVALTGDAAAYPVTVRLEGEDSRIRSGMAATVIFELVDEQVAQGAAADVQRLLVQGVAVGEDLNGNFVFVLEDSGTEGIAVARRRGVEVGVLTPDGVEIRSGLEAGDKIATAGVRRIKDGQSVRLLEAWGS
ncbi:MAG: efflux RND transporter periplasmic adaptor subunit [Acidobacteriota bacterium]